MGLSTLQLAIEQFDLVQYVMDHGAREIQLGEWALRCPLCGKDEKLIVNIERRQWHCWVCERFVTVTTPFGPRKRAVAGAGGLVDLVAVLDGVPRDKAVDQVIAAGRHIPHELGVLPERLVADRSAAGVARLAAPIPYPPGAQPIARYEDWPYLQARGITPEDVRQFRLFVCTTGRYAHRLVFPVFDHDQLIYYQARAMWAAQPGERYIKTLNPPDDGVSVRSSDVLMNLDVAKLYSRVAIVEGPVDCVHAGASAVCSFGKKISDAQIALLVRAGVRAVDLMWDADAWEDILLAAPRLVSLFDVRLVRLPGGDPGERSRAELDWWRARAMPCGTPVHYVGAV